MDRITALKARRAGLIEDMEALVASAGDDGLSAEQAAQFDDLKAQDDKVAAELARAEDLERRKAAAAKPVAALPGGPAPVASTPAAPAEKGLTFARMVRTLAAAGGNAFVAQQIAEANGDSGLFANQNTQTGGAGGFLVPEDVSSEIVELLRPASVVMSMNPVVVPMPNGNLTMNRIATGSTASYFGEQQDVPATGITHGQFKLSAKKLGALVPVSNDLMRMASTAYDRIVRDDVVTSCALRMDLAFLRGTGTEYSPRGFRNLLIGTSLEALNILVMTATPDLPKVTNDLGRLELALLNQNVPMTRAGWIMAPRTQMYLMNLRDGNGNYAFPEVQQGRLRNKPIFLSNQIPTNLGGGTESEIYLVDAAHIVVGEHMGIQIAMSTEAAYKDAAGTMQAAFSRDETVMRAILQHDINARHLAAIAILTGVTWGA
jgi:HK97 family phage major capsid protein